ncbi:hypothetical protein PoB_001438500 [Plakobranchus ocellatus]|uniref:Uncharacterized protein n=1 Tax=Plakobranchus ocellatus TaxID=259542 RepID=A0AAV3YZQ0_9GAST|nr:hypothetical protein PoB_001438500 [Plakobranchus ocellatus]
MRFSIVPDLRILAPKVPGLATLAGSFQYFPPCETRGKNVLYRIAAGRKRRPRQLVAYKLPIALLSCLLLLLLSPTSIHRRPPAGQLFKNRAWVNPSEVPHPLHGVEVQSSPGTALEIGAICPLIGLYGARSTYYTTLMVNLKLNDQVDYCIVMSPLLAAAFALFLYLLLRLLNITQPATAPLIYAKDRSSQFVQSVVTMCPILHQP